MTPLAAKSRSTPGAIEPTASRARCSSGHASQLITVVVGLGLSPSVAAEPSQLSPESGYAYGELETARAAALGGAVRAFSSSTEAQYLNPANLSASRVYHLAGLAQFWPAAERQSYGAAVVDSIVSRSRLSGGLSVNWVFQDPDGIDRSALDGRFVLSLPASDRLLLGVAARYLEVTQDGVPRDAPVPAPSVFSGGLRDEAALRELTLDAGLTIRPSSSVNLAFVGYNLTNPGHSLLPLVVGGGLGVGSDQLIIEADALFDFTTFDDTQVRAMIGVEYFAADQYPLRVGYRYDAGVGEHSISGGLGYVQREFALDVALRRHLGPDHGTAFFLSFKYHVESTALLSDY